MAACYDFASAFGACDCQSVECQFMSHRHTPTKCFSRPKIVELGRNTYSLYILISCIFVVIFMHITGALLLLSLPFINFVIVKCDLICGSLCATRSSNIKWIIYAMMHVFFIYIDNSSLVLFWTTSPLLAIVRMK